MANIRLAIMIDSWCILSDDLWQIDYGWNRIANKTLASCSLVLSKNENCCYSFIYQSYTTKVHRILGSSLPIILKTQLFDSWLLFS